MKIDTSDLKIITLNYQHMQDILLLRSVALKQLNHPDNYVIEDNEEEFVSNHLGTLGVSLGFKYNNKLIAYCSLTTDIHNHNDSELSLLQKLNPQHNWGFLATTVIHPEFRGLKIHNLSINSRKKLAYNMGLTKLGITVSPHNHISLRNLFKEQAYIKNIGLLCDNCQRFLLEMPTDSNVSHVNYNTDVIILAKDTEKAKILLQNGYIGRDIFLENMNSFIIYSGNNDDNVNNIIQTNVKFQMYPFGYHHFT